MSNIRYETTQKVEFDISLELDDLNVIEDSRISFEISLANHQTSRYG
jgi:hypothetical protein